MGMFLLVTSTAMYSGDTIYRDLTGEIKNLQSFECNLTAENYNLNGSNLTVNSTGYILSTVPNFKSDNLTVTCLLNGQKWVSSGGSGGGGSGGGYYYGWNCTEWGECIDGNSQRVCEKRIVYSSNEARSKPNESISCTNPIVIPIETSISSSDTTISSDVEEQLEEGGKGFILWII